MGNTKITSILIVCFSLMGFLMDGASAEEVILPIAREVYQMISSPVLPEDPDPQLSLVDDLGPYNKNQWRLFRYEPSQEKYIELKTPDWDPERHDFDFGRGYWIISKNPTEIDIQGEPVVEDWIILEHEGDGWNQVGNIFDYDFPIVSLYVVRITDPDPLLNRVQLIDAVNNDLTYVTLQEFENGSYIDIPGNGKNSLEVGKGYWLRVREGVGEDVILWFVVRGLNALAEGVYLSETFLQKIAQQDAPPDPPPGVKLSGAGSSGGGSGGCFIATAAYGSEGHPHLQILRDFRDRYLLTARFGRVFVDLYYRYSPAMARYVAKRTPVKALIRVILLPAVGIVTLLSKMDEFCLLFVFALPFFCVSLVKGKRRGARDNEN